LRCAGAALLAGLAVCAPASAIDHIDGISDQHLAAWAGSLSAESVLSEPFPGALGGSWAGAGGSRIAVARYVVQWNVMQGAGYADELTALESWYDTSLQLGLTPELALANYDCAGCAAPPSVQSFAAGLAALHAAFPEIAIYEAWNEPNLAGSFHIAPAFAAALMNATYAFCAGNGCTALAGDLSDADAQMASYEREYERALDPRDPRNWAVHLYHAVKYESLQTLDTFVSLLPSPHGDSLWLTELGAYHCEFGELRGDARQEENARFLTGPLLASAHAVHAMYFQGAWPYDDRPPCKTGTQDTALYAAERAAGPALARPAASVVLGAGAPRALTLSPGL
jgi:Glycosyl hydrolase catalytic core